MDGGITADMSWLLITPITVILANWSINHIFVQITSTRQGAPEIWHWKFLIVQQQMSIAAPD